MSHYVSFRTIVPNHTLWTDANPSTLFSSLFFFSHLEFEGCSLHACVQTRVELMDCITQAAMGPININYFCFMNISYENSRMKQQLRQVMEPLSLWQAVMVCDLSSLQRQIKSIHEHSNYCTSNRTVSKRRHLKDCSD